MPEATTAAAPASTNGAAPHAQQAASVPPSGKAPVVPQGQPKPTAEPAADAWSPDDDRAFAALAKKRGLKVKANGQETEIGSMEALLKELEFSARGRGASKLAEQSKKEAEEAKKVRAEAEALVRIVEAARAGDINARRQLGFAAPDEMSEEEQVVSQLSPSERALYEQNRQLEQQMLEYRAQVERSQAEEKQRREETLKGESRKSATTYVSKVLDALGFDFQADADEARPFLAAAYQAMREFSEAGLDLAADTTPEMIVRRIQELRADASEKSWGRLKLTRKLELMRPQLEKLGEEVFGSFDEQGKQVAQGSGDIDSIVNALGSKFSIALAKAVAQKQRAAKQAPRAPQQEQRQPEQTQARPVVKAAFGWSR